MTAPTRAVRVYLATLMTVTTLLVLWGVLTQGLLPPSIVWTVLLFGGLTLVGERVTFRIAGVRHNLAASTHVATIALLPPPFPLLIALTTIGATQLPSRRAPYKKVFNIAHTTLVVGLPSLAYAALAPIGPTLAPTALLTHLPAALVLLGGYSALDHILLRLFFFLAAPAPRHLARRDLLPVEALPALLAEVGALSVGLCAAVLYRVHPAFLALLAAPIAVLYAAFRIAARHAETWERRSAHLEAVLVAAQALRVQHSAADLLAHVAASARAITGASAVAAYLRDPEAPALLERLALDAAEAAPQPGPTRLRSPDAGAEIVEEDADGGRVALVPIAQAEGGVVGLLRLDGLARALPADERDALTILAAHAALALDNAHHHARALAQASEDSLTALLNHRAFQTRLEEEVARARRGQHSLAVVMIDLDGFGAINNAHGHQAGDVTLVAVARALRAQTRYADVVARYGGDEFAAILPETAVDEGLALAERIRGEVARLTVAHGPRAIHVTASIGVAVLPGHATTREDLIGAADSAAYAAKRAGKNRVRAAEAGALPRDPTRIKLRNEQGSPFGIIRMWMTL